MVKEVVIVVHVGVLSAIFTGEPVAVFFKFIKSGVNPNVSQNQRACWR